MSTHAPLLTLTFADGSVFSLPEEWEDAFVDRFGPDPAGYPAVAQGIRFVTGKYVEHTSVPTKFDGLPWLAEDREIDDSALDDPAFYWQPWDEADPPAWAGIAREVMYFELRTLILQQALQSLGVRTRVVSPEDFARELEEEQERTG
jgi:hypothetical protein